MTRRNNYHDDRDRIDELRRKDNYAPNPDEIKDALDDLLKGDTTDLPSVSTTRVLEEAGMIPVSVRDLNVVELSIEHGQPMHGEMRSDDHISDYVVNHDGQCPECDKVARLRYEYHAHHHIAGHYKHSCRDCGHVLEEEEWY